MLKKIIDVLMGLWSTRARTSVWGVPVEFDVSIFIPVLLALLVGDPRMVIIAAAATPSILVHELGHMWMALKCGLSVKRMYVAWFGGATEFRRHPTSNVINFMVSVAGPGASMLLAVPFAMFGTCFDIAALNHIAVLNVFFALSNMLPIFPLDGGHALHAVINSFLKNEKTAMVYVVYFSIGFIIGCLVLSIVFGFTTLTHVIVTSVLMMVVIMLYMYFRKRSELS